MLEKVREALRLDDDCLDGEINDLILACIADLKLNGIVNIVEDDPLILQAVKTYAKAHFDISNQDFEKLVSSYESLKSHLSLTEEYTVKTDESIET